MDFEEIIRRARRKDEDAFSVLVDSYKNYVFAIILNFTRDQREAENIAQEVFLQVYLSLDSYQEDNFKSWLSRLAANKTIDYLRKKRVDFKEETQENSQALAEDLGQELVETPEEALLKKERKEKLDRICQELPEIYRQVIEDFYFYGRSYKEIAKREGISEKSVASRLYRGKILLREKWRD